MIERKPQPPHLRWYQRRVFLLPVEVGRLADFCLPADLGDRRASLAPCLMANAFRAPVNLDALMPYPRLAEETYGRKLYPQMAEFSGGRAPSIPLAQ